MKKNQYEVVKVKGYTFFFKYEPPENELLHIWVRHLTKPENAIRTFFTSNPVWNDEHKRYETIKVILRH